MSADSWIIPAHTPEKERLEKQYTMKKNMYGWTNGLPASMTPHLEHFSTVLDIAAGTCVWILDFAKSPLIQSRFQNKSQSPRLYACDLNTGFFPDPAVTDKFGITTFQQDVTKPFPQELYGTFDLIHISFLAICLTESGWKAALDNCYKLLKPDGFLFIDELDPVLYRNPTDLAPDAINHDFDKCMNGNTWIQKANCIYTGFSIHRGHISNLTIRMPSLLQTAGLKVIASERGIGPLGKACRTEKGLTGLPISDYEDFSVECMSLIFEHQAAALMAEGVLEAPKGTKITTQEQLKELLDEVARGIINDGAVAFARCFFAQKVDG